MKNPGRHQKSVMRKLFDLKQKPPNIWRLFLYDCDSFICDRYTIVISCVDVDAEPVTGPPAIPGGASNVPFGTRLIPISITKSYMACASGW